MNDPIREPPIAGAILFLLAGPILWGGHLLAVYTFHAVACAVGGSWATTIVPGSIVVATLATAGALLLAFSFPGKLAQALRCADQGDDQPFLIRAERLLTVLALTGVLWTGSGALALGPCAQFR
ncbi:hypothetical protein HR059_22865 (plasmid) [Sinorhizobium meliloti WSM1022]|uniref:hypothetical protein n=1 Tax=Rhizobium meliloti TaxID=382 RepID=UPI00041F2923|nr:hypothetical protein [Sinorhizobium meliloti]MDW9356084.1 hypothetical protein [Sinorhizobium meliloti]MDW9482323.1 hypothetical protein [Sinorhizobium meliloti]MDW9580575.1 hypothetical protein [Sinorhizobium meliloti]MDW9654854.1 hypothetical protein [Sinorhizobium meliloti]MDW9684214.1 hypothetical protein [Sinorhizobium meliloti]